MTPAIRSRAFTLTEVMIALGILVIGISMVGSAFPIAALENQQSVDDTAGTLMTDNALSLCRGALSHKALQESPPPSGQTALTSLLTDQTRRVASADHTGPLTYPSATPASPLGWRVLMRQAAAESNDYQMVFLGYRLFPGLTTAPQVGAATTAANSLSPPVGKFLKVGAPVVNQADGSFAFIVSVNPATKAGTLSGPVTAGAAWTDLADNAGEVSAFITVAVARTAVRP